jgi:hypothetical protein
MQRLQSKRHGKDSAHPSSDSPTARPNRTLAQDFDAKLVAYLSRATDERAIRNCCSIIFYDSTTMYFAKAVLDAINVIAYGNGGDLSIPVCLTSAPNTSPPRGPPIGISFGKAFGLVCSRDAVTLTTWAYRD